MGEEFGEVISSDEASSHECCEVIWSVLGQDVIPATLAALTDREIAKLAQSFGEYFGIDAPTVEQVKKALSRTLARWPIGSI